MVAHNGVLRPEWEEVGIHTRAEPCTGKPGPRRARRAFM